MESRKTPLEMAGELDEMERDVTSEEATLLEKALKDLKHGKELRPKDLEKLRAMHQKYLAEPDEDDEEVKRPVVEDPDEEIDEADF